MGRPAAVSAVAIDGRRSTTRRKESPVQPAASQRGPASLR